MIEKHMILLLDLVTWECIEMKISLPSFLFFKNFLFLAPPWGWYATHITDHRSCGPEACLSRGSCLQYGSPQHTVCPMEGLAHPCWSWLAVSNWYRTRLFSGSNPLPHLQPGSVHTSQFLSWAPCKSSADPALFLHLWTGITPDFSVCCSTHLLLACTYCVLGCS